jgi:ferredoxin
MMRRRAARHEDLNTNEKGETMKVHGKDDECVGDGICAELCPEMFKMERDLAIAKKGDVPQELEDLVRKAAESCPVDAMFLDE